MELSCPNASESYIPRLESYNRYVQICIDNRSQADIQVKTENKPLQHNLYAESTRTYTTLAIAIH